MDGEQLLGGRYALVDQIGVGGMAVVWHARDEVLGRSVAVKLLAGKHAGEPDARDRIRAEARAAAALSHPNIAQVYDYGEAQERGASVPYVVMELVRGGTLQERMDAGPMSPRFAMRMAAEIAAALAAAHTDGLVHRDIKPANVMVTPAGAKVVDFGIAAAINPGGTGDEEFEVLGTPAYLAPERLTADGVQPASDVYALGVLLYRMLSGHSPWSADTTTQMLSAHIYIDPQPLPPRPGVPDYVTALCNRCLSKDPTQRPSAREAAALLAQGAGLRVVEDAAPVGPAGPGVDSEPSVLIRPRSGGADGPAAAAVGGVDAVHPAVFAPVRAPAPGLVSGSASGSASASVSGSVPGSASGSGSGSAPGSGSGSALGSASGSASGSTPGSALGSASGSDGFGPGGSVAATGADEAARRAGTFTPGVASAHGVAPGEGLARGAGSGGVSAHGSTPGVASAHGATSGVASAHGATSGGGPARGATSGGEPAHGATSGVASAHDATSGGGPARGATTGGWSARGATSGMASASGAAASGPGVGAGPGSAGSGAREDATYDPAVPAARGEGRPGLPVPAARGGVKPGPAVPAARGDDTSGPAVRAAGGAAALVPGIAADEAGASARRRRRGVVAVTVAVALLAVVGLLWWLIGPDDDARQSAAAPMFSDAPASAAAPSAGASAAGKLGAPIGGPSGAATPTEPAGGLPGRTAPGPGVPPPVDGTRPTSTPPPDVDEPTPTTTAPTTDPPAQEATFTSAGGSLRATCPTASTAQLLSWSATEPYKVKKVVEGPAAKAVVNFKYKSSHFRMIVTCAGGVPSNETIEL